MLEAPEGKPQHPGGILWLARVHACLREVRSPHALQLQEPCGFEESIAADEKRQSAALPSFLVIAAYFYVRLIPRNFGCLAS
jgi:hypothetical protein